MQKILLSIISILFISTSLFGQDRGKNFQVWANGMQKTVPNTAVLPSDYTIQKSYPVVYLLHGYSGNYRDWIDKVSIIEELATKYQLILILPDGENNWYIDSPVIEKSKYESYMINDLLPAVDSLFSTKKGREYRAITGLSMGGHGAMSLAIKNKNKFSAAGSMSGVLAFPKSKQQKALNAFLGDRDENAANWDRNEVFSLIETLKPGELKIFIDCGIDDYLIDCTQLTHTKMVELKIPHDCTIRHGVHNWEYWSNAIQYQLLYMYLHFNAVK